MIHFPLMMILPELRLCDVPDPCAAGALARLLIASPPSEGVP